MDLFNNLYIFGSPNCSEISFAALLHFSAVVDKSLETVNTESFFAARDRGVIILSNLPRT